MSEILAPIVVGALVGMLLGVVFGLVWAYLRLWTHSIERRARYREEFYQVANELLDLGRELPPTVASDLDKMVADIESKKVAWALYRAVSSVVRDRQTTPHFEVDMPDTKAQRLRYVARMLFFLTLSYRWPLIGLLTRSQMAQLFVDPSGVEARRTFNRTLKHDAIA